MEQAQINYYYINQKEYQQNMKPSDFFAIIDSVLKTESAELKDYLKSTYISRSDHWTNSSPNQYQHDPTLLAKNKTILLKLFPSLTQQTVDNIIKIYISYELEQIEPKKTAEIMCKHNKFTREKFNELKKFSYKGRAGKKFGEEEPTKVNVKGEAKPLKQTECGKKSDMKEAKEAKVGSSKQVNN